MLGPPVLDFGDDGHGPFDRHGRGLGADLLRGSAGRCGDRNIRLGAGELGEALSWAGVRGVAVARVDVLGEAFHLFFFDGFLLRFNDFHFAAMFLRFEDVVLATVLGMVCWRQQVYRVARGSSGRCYYEALTARGAVSRLGRSLHQIRASVPVVADCDAGMLYMSACGRGRAETFMPFTHSVAVCSCLDRDAVAWDLA